MDSEFLENAIVYSIVPFGFFGLNSDSAHTLSVAPNLPKELSFWRMENLMYNGVIYDMEVADDYVILESVRGNTDGLQCEINLPAPSETPQVYCNGTLMSSDAYTVANGVVTVKVDFRAQKIQVK